jgi:hypothetical protein
MTVRTMYDAIGQNADVLPDTADMVAGYVQGQFAWTSGDWARFPKAAHVRVATLSEDWPAASVVDSEVGALTPAQCRGFVTGRDEFRPHTATVYRDWAGLPQLLRACAGLTYDLWLAWWIGHAPNGDDIARVRSVLPDTVSLVAWQYANLGLYDVSAVLDPDWHPEPRR